MPDVPPPGTPRSSRAAPSQALKRVGMAGPALCAERARGAGLPPCRRNRCDHPRGSFAALGQLMLLGDALECLIDRLDAIEKVAAFSGKQAQNFVPARRERAAQASRLVVDEL